MESNTYIAPGSRPRATSVATVALLNVSAPNSAGGYDDQAATVAQLAAAMLQTVAASLTPAGVVAALLALPTTAGASGSLYWNAGVLAKVA
jgi:hypothetical protein